MKAISSDYQAQLIYTQSSYAQFKHPFVRDLAFALSCPSLLTSWSALIRQLATSSTDGSISTLENSPEIAVHSDDFWQRQFTGYQQRLVELDTTSDYQELTKFLLNRPSPHRLGFHFEGLLLFWLLDGFRLNLHPFQVLAHNLQLIDNKTTVGELDLLINNNDTGQVEHWELAIKFYLGSAPFEPINWVGLNRKDNLERKLIHMMSKPFSHDYVSIEGTRYRIDKRYAVIKGRLFRPAVAPSPTAPTAKLAASNFLDDTSGYQDGYPAWLNPTFPLHQWTDNPDMVHALAAQYRQAKYVEWFTPRPFYNNKLSATSDIASRSAVATGLYFLHNVDEVESANPVVSNRLYNGADESALRYFVVKLLAEDADKHH